MSNELNQGVGNTNNEENEREENNNFENIDDTVKEPRTLEEIEAEISELMSKINSNNLEKKEAEIKYYYEIGKLLIESEAHLKKTGDFGKWANEKFGLSRSMARHCYNAAGNFDITQVLTLGISKASILVTKLPPKERKLFTEVGHCVEDNSDKVVSVYDMSRTKLIETLKYYKNNLDIQIRICMEENPVKYLGKKLYDKLVSGENDEEVQEYEQQEDEDNPNQMIFSTIPTCEQILEEAVNKQNIAPTEAQENSETTESIQEKRTIIQNLKRIIKNIITRVLSIIKGVR